MYNTNLQPNENKVSGMINYTEYSFYCLISLSYSK